MCICHNSHWGLSQQKSFMCVCLYIASFLYARFLSLCLCCSDESLGFTFTFHCQFGLSLSWFSFHFGRLQSLFTSLTSNSRQIPEGDVNMFILDVEGGAYLKCRCCGFNQAFSDEVLSPLLKSMSVGYGRLKTHHISSFSAFLLPKSMEVCGNIY